MSKPNGKLMIIVDGNVVDQKSLTLDLNKAIQEMYLQVWHELAPDAHRIGAYSVARFAKVNHLEVEVEDRPKKNPVLKMESFSVELEPTDDEDMYVVQTAWVATVEDSLVTFAPKLHGEGDDSVINWELMYLLNDQLTTYTFPLQPAAG